MPRRRLVACLAAVGILAAGASGVRFATAEEAPPAGDASPLPPEKHPPPVINQVPAKSKGATKAVVKDDVHKRKGGADTKKPGDAKGTAAKGKATGAKANRR